MLPANTEKSEVIRVVVADADEGSQRNIQAIFATEPDVVASAQCATVEDTLGFVREALPNVLIVDLGLADRGATRIVKAVLQEYPDLGVIVLTLHDEKQCLLEYLNWGARGFILKPAETETTLTAVRLVARGERFVDPLLPHCLVSHYLANPAAAASKIDTARLEVLTIREREVCRYLASGYTNAEVADFLRISKRTVETHRAAIMAKVGVRSRAQLVHFAIEHGLWPEPESVHLVAANRTTAAAGE